LAEETVLREAIGNLHKEIKDTHKQFQEDYGTKLTNIQTSLGEIEERQEQADKAFTTAEQTKELVERMVTMSRELSYAIASNRPQTRPFDYNYYRSVTDPGECRQIHDHFLQRLPYDDREAEYHRSAARLTMMRAWMTRSPNFKNWYPGMSKHPEVRDWWGTYRTIQKDLFGDEFVARAFDTTDAIAWVPTILSTELIRFLEVRGGLIPAFRNFSLPGGTYDVPIVTSAAKGHMFNERVDPPTVVYNYTSGNLYTVPPTAKRTFNSQTVRTFIIASRQFIEETVVPMIDFAIDETRTAVRRAIGDAMLNGDRVTPHFDSDGGTYGGDAFGVENNRHLWHGFRMHANANAVVSNGFGTLDFADFAALLSLMSRYGAQPPSDLVWIFALAAYPKLLTIDQFSTFEKIGNRATVLTGAVGQILGANLIVDEDMRQDLAPTTGLFDNVTLTSSAPICVHRPSWWLGNFTGIETEPERLAGWDQDVIWARWRGDFMKMRADAEKSEGFIRNILN